MHNRVFDWTVSAKEAKLANSDAAAPWPVRYSVNRPRWVLAALLAFTSPILSQVAVAAEISAETLVGVETEYTTIRAPGGYRLQAMVTRPRGVTTRLPVIYYVQWLSCDTVRISDVRDGWTQMLRGLVEKSGYVVVRVDKASVGGSEGPNCASELDYETELRDHRAGFEFARQHRWVDRGTTFLFGASMGTTFAPLIAQDNCLAGVAVWGGGARTWFERQLGFERRALELSAVPTSELDARMKEASAAYSAFLLDGLAPPAFAAPAAAAWQRLTGMENNKLFGRPAAFHQQAQAQNWAAAWGRVKSPVLVALGQYDWYEGEANARLIVDVVNRKHPGTATFRQIPELDHHFARFQSQEAAFRDEGARADAAPFLAELLPWLHGLSASLRPC